MPSQRGAWFALREFSCELRLLVCSWPSLEVSAKGDPTGKSYSVLVATGVRFRSFNTCSYPSMSNFKSDSLSSLGMNALNRLLLKKAIEDIAIIIITAVRAIEAIKSHLSNPGLVLPCVLITEKY